MPIDIDKVMGAELPTGVFQWDASQVILYHLGIGAGVPPTDPSELEYTYEQNLKVLPSFGVLPVFPTLAGMVGLDGMSFNPMMLLHGEQDITLHQPLPTEAKVESRGKIIDIFDKTKGAAIVTETETLDDRGSLLCNNRFTAFVRGEGGFGGQAGPRPGNQAPDREPDLVFESPTLPQQALLYRLSGDRNPLHVDPSMANLGGFERPILHGLCSFGIVCKAVVDGMLDGDVTAVSRYQVRFAGVCFPGETIVSSMWREDDRVIVRAVTKERNTDVITNAAVTTRA